MTTSRFSSIRFWLPHLAALLVIAGSIHLAGWQVERAAEKEYLMSQWEEAPALSLNDLGAEPRPRYSLVAGSGHFYADRHVLLDNQIRNNHPGVHVFTPFRPQGSNQIILVNRGWQPWDRRAARMPDLDTPEHLVQIEGRLNEPPRVGLQIGQAQALDPDNWPNLMTYFDMDRIRDAFDDSVIDQVLLLDPQHPAHLTGDEWRLINMGPERHRGYAFQWASIAIAVFLIWLILTIRSFRRK
ncbi:MAG: SURF1 family protein [Wenzhouxiangella sp.]